MYKLLCNGRVTEFVSLNSALEASKNLIFDWAIVDPHGEVVFDWADRVGP